MEKARRQSEWPPEKVVAEWLPTLFSGAVSDEVVDETVGILSEFHPAGMRAMLNAFAKADLRDVLPIIEVPTLLLYGELDRRSPLNVARELKSKIPMSTLVVIPGAGHECNVEAPEAFNSEVRRFLALCRD